MSLPSLDAMIGSATVLVALAILLSGLDDLFIDVCYYVLLPRRRSFAARRGRVSERRLRREPEKPVAVMVPAWREDAVIRQMLRNTLRTVEYSDFEVFVGTYPNDEPTMRAVAEVAEEDPRVHRIVCPHGGPTSKADCLNWIIAGIGLREKAAGRRFAILVLHDCEDLVHPLSLKLLNHYIPDYSMVQLPVIPMLARLSQLTGGTYLDEFAECHLKDLLVRERLSGMVPSAGVGTGFSREAIGKLELEFDNQVFNIATFTEDYDLAFRLHAVGERSMLLLYYARRARGRQGGPGSRAGASRELVGTREYFPTRFSAAVRQKARWTLGIVFHGWQQRGWEGGAVMLYTVWRDRKGVLTYFVNMLGYLLIAEAGLNAWLGYREAGEDVYRAPGWLWKVLVVDTLLLANRCGQRMAASARLYDWRQAALSLPRIVWGNVINFCADLRATSQFVRTAVTGRRLVWAKTAHVFPTEEQLLKMSLGGGHGQT